MRNITTLDGAIKSSPFIKSRSPLQLQPSVDHAQRRAICRQMRGHQSWLDANDVKNVQGWIFPGWIIASVGHTGRWTSFYTLFRNTSDAPLPSPWREFSVHDLSRWNVCKYSYISRSISFYLRHLYRSQLMSRLETPLDISRSITSVDSWQSK